MTWFKVDDNLALHPKVLAAGNAAVGLWVRAGAWSAQQLTDGFIPTGMVRVLGDSRQARALVEVGLWIAVSGGYRFHEWEQRNPLRSDVEERRAAEHAAKVRAGQAGGLASGRARRARSRSEADAKQPASVLLEAKRSPDPTRPDPGSYGPTSHQNDLPSRKVTRARGEGAWHALVVESRRAAGQPVTGWATGACQRAVDQAAAEHGTTPDVAWQALVHLAADPTTEAPGRLTHQLARVVDAHSRPHPPLRAVPSPAALPPDEQAARARQARQALRKGTA